MSATCEAPREVVVEQPYVGPRPFERNDADKRRFFARDREAEEITALITAHPAVLLYATSGAGKTSLINTKLDSLLRDLPAEILPPPRVRLDADAVVSSEELEPGNIFISSVLHYWAGSDTRPGETLAGFLRRQDRPTGPDSETTIRVIILDQFEEIFTSSPEHWRHRRGFFEQIRDALEGSPTTLSPSEIRDPARLAERIAAGKTPIDAYIRDRLTREPRGRQVGGTGVATVLKPDTDTLVAGLNRIIQNAELCRGRRADRAPLTPEMLGFLQSNGSPRDMLRLNRKLLELAFPDEIVPCVEGDPSLRVLLAMREDYIAELDPYTALLPEQLQIRFRLERLREPAALRAVTGPLEVLEKQGGAAQFEAGAAEDLVRNLMGNDEFVEPVQLQVVCANLWEAVAQTGRNVIRNDDIKKYADVSEALLKYYEKCLAEAVGSDVREGELRRWFETKLITPAGTRGTVYKGTDHTEGIPNRPVEILDRLHLIKPEVRDGATWYELAHDRFIEPILTSNHVWRSRRSEQTLKALEEKARAWADARAQGQEGVGLLDEDELARAEAWLTTSDAVDLGPSETVRRFVQESRKAVEDDRKHREDEQRRDREAAKAREREHEHLYNLKIQAEALARAKQKELADQTLYSRRLRRLLYGLAASLVVALIMACVALIMAHRARQNEIRAVQSRKEAFNHAKIGVARGLMMDAWDLIASDPDLSVNLNEKAVELVRGADRPSPRATAKTERALRFALRASRVRDVTSPLHQGGATVAAYNRAGKRIVTGGKDGIARVWSVSDLNPWEIKPDRETRIVDSSKQPIPINFASFGPYDDRSFGPGDNWNQTRNLLACGNPNDSAAPGRALVWFPDSGTGDGKLVELVAPGLDHQGPVLAAAFSHDGKLTVTGDLAGAVRVWDAESGKLKATLPASKDRGPINAVAFHPRQSGLVAVASGDKNKDVNTSTLKFNQVPDSPMGRGPWLWKWDAPSGSDATIPLSGHRGPVAAIAFSPDGNRVVTAGTDQTARLWDVSKAQEANKVSPIGLLLGHTGPLSTAAFSPDGQLVVTASADQTARVWDANTLSQVAQLLGHTAWINTASFGPKEGGGVKGQFVVTASFDGTARVFEARTGILRASLLGHRGAVNFADFSPDAQAVVSAGEDGTARISEVEQRVTAEFKGPDAQINVTSMSHDQQFVITAGLDCQAWIWEASPAAKGKGKWPKILTGHKGPLTDAQFSPDDELVATASFDGTAQIWENWRTLDSPVSAARVLTGHKARVTGVAFSPQKVDLPGHGPTWLLVTAGQDGTMRLWNTRSGEELHPEARMQGYTSWLTSAVFSPDGLQIVAPGEGIRQFKPQASGGAVLLKWSDDAGKTVSKVDLKDPESSGPPPLVSDAVFSPDGSFCFTAGSDGVIRVWDGKTGTLLTRLEGHYADVSRLVIDAQGRRLVSEGRDGMGIVWDLTDLRERTKKRDLGRLTGLSGPHVGVAISPGGRWVVSEHGRLGARLWDLDKLQPKKMPVGVRLHDAQGVISAVAFSPAPDRPLFVTAGSDGSAWLCDAEPKDNKPKLRFPLNGFRSMVTSVCFSADGKLVAASGADYTVRVWNSETGMQVPLRAAWASTPHETLPVFAPVDQWLITRGNDGPCLRDLSRANFEPMVLKGSIAYRPAFSADGKRIATVGYDRIVRIWETQTGKELAEPKLGESSQMVTRLPINCLAYRPDGLAVVLSWRGQDPPSEEHAREKATVFDTLSGAPIGIALAHSEPVNAAAFSPDSTMIATVGGQSRQSVRPQNAVKLWRRDSQTGSWQFDKQLMGHKEVVIGVAFSPDSRFLVTASRDNTARVWKASTGELLLALETHRGDVSSASFSLDGRFLLTVSMQDGTARVWDLTPYETPDGKELDASARSGELAVLHGGYTGPGDSFTPGLVSDVQALGDVTTAVFRPDSRAILTAGGDGVARLYFCELFGGLGDLAAVAKNRPIWQYGGGGPERRPDREKFFGEYNQIIRMEEKNPRQPLTSSGVTDAVH